MYYFVFLKEIEIKISPKSKFKKYFDYDIKDLVAAIK